MLEAFESYSIACAIQEPRSRQFLIAIAFTVVWDPLLVGLARNRAATTAFDTHARTPKREKTQGFQGEAR